MPARGANERLPLLPPKHLEDLFWSPWSGVGLVWIWLHTLSTCTRRIGLTGLSRLSRLCLIISIIVGIVLIILAIVGVSRCSLGHSRLLIVLRDGHHILLIPHGLHRKAVLGRLIRLVDIRRRRLDLSCC